MQWPTNESVEAINAFLTYHCIPCQIGAEGEQQWKPESIAEVRQFVSLPADAVGLDDIGPASCWANGSDTAVGFGLPFDSPYWSALVEYWATATAKSSELI